MYEEKLVELNVTELRNEDGEYKYVLTAYDDITEIKYFEKNKEGKMQEVTNSSFSLPSVYDIQICEKIIELRKQADCR
jgi:hypothetical protein